VANQELEYAQLKPKSLAGVDKDFALR